MMNHLKKLKTWNNKQTESGRVISCQRNQTQKEKTAE